MKRSAILSCLLLGILLLAAAIPPVGAGAPITGVSPQVAKNVGSVTLRITGDGIQNATEIRLTKCRIQTGTPGGTTYGAIQDKGLNWITATFDVNGKNVGEYNLSAPVPNLALGGADDWHVSGPIFTIYSASGPTPTTTTAGTTTTTVATTTTSSDQGTGSNDVFFQTEPSGAEVWVDGIDVGTSTFVFHTTMTGTHDVVVRKTGYEDYPAKVTILQGTRINFYAPLVLNSTSPDDTLATSTGKTTPAPSATGTTRKSTLKIPTPLGTDPPTTTEDSPADPAIVVLAAALGIGAVVIRRR